MQRSCSCERQEVHAGRWGRYCRNHCCNGFSNRPTRSDCLLHVAWRPFLMFAIVCFNGLPPLRREIGIGVTISAGNAPPPVYMPTTSRFVEFCPTHSGGETHPIIGRHGTRQARLLEDYMYCITGVAFQAWRSESRVIYPKHEFRTENFRT